MDIFIKVILLLLMFSTVWQNTDADCPSNCECKRGWYYTIIMTCHDRMTIPENIPPRTLKLLLAGNEIQMLNPGIFKGLDSLNEIQLQKNKIRYIQKGVFDLASLEYLNLSWNAIEVIEPESFKQARYLEVLDLNGNAIKQLKRNTFIGLPYLTYLYLTNNSMETIEGGAFTGLQSVIIIHLIFNNIQNLEYGVFKGLTSLIIINLRENSIDHIDDGVFEEQTYLQTLNLGYNKIKKVRSGTFRGLHSVQDLNLRNNRIKVLDNGTFNETKVLHSLFINDNQLQDIKAGAFEGLESLSRLEIDNCGLKTVGETWFRNTPSLTLITLVDNYIQTLKTETLSGLTGLLLVYLSKNSITSLPGTLFNDTKDIVSIFLQTNQLRTIEPGTFEGLVKLERLNLSYNKLEWIRGDEFLTLNSLQILGLNNNNIKHIAAGSFKEVQSLSRLNLDNNNMTVLPVGIFNNMKNLVTLQISNSNVQELMPGTFHALTALRTLNLNKNKIAKLKGGIFNGTRDLDNLDFSDNEISVIEENAIEGFPKLTKLRLQNNKISYIKRGTFLMVSHLTLLNLSGNNIENIENGSFRAKRVEQLDISRNKIQHIEEEILESFTALKYLFLGSNKLSYFGKELLKSRNIYRMHLDNNLFERFEPGTFTSLTTTPDIIKLENNKMRHVEEGIFSNNSRLEKLHLQENIIETIAPGAFQNCTSLKDLNLYGNRLTYLDSRTFMGLQELYLLKLSRNRLKYLPEGIFSGLHHLTILVMQENEFSAIPRFNKIPLRQLFLGSNRIKSLENFKFMRNISELSNVFLDNNRIERIVNETFKGATKLNTISLTGNPLRVIEDGAFLSLPSLKVINMLDTQLAFPLNIWPTRTLITYFVLQSKESTTNIVLRGQETGSKLVLVTLGYFCKHVAYDSYDCEPCSRGSFKSPSTQNCELCPPGGFYQDEMGYSSIIAHDLGCKQCPPGSYVKPEVAPGKSQTDCQSCPPGTNLKEYAKFRACKCMDNYYRLHRFGPCSKCTKGYECLNESINLAPGFFWVWQSKEFQQQYETFKNDLMTANAKHKIISFNGKIANSYACPVADSCLGKRYSRCSKGYEGPLCAICGKGYFKVLTKCRECPTLPWIIGQIAMASLGMALLVFVVLWEKKKDPNNPSRTLTDIFLARLKIIIGFYQVSSATFDAYSYISWPGLVVTIMKYAKMVQLNLLLIAPVNCINHSFRADAYTQLLLSVTITGFVILMGPVLNYFIKCYVTHKVKGKANQEIQMRQYREKSYRLLILILFITFPSTCTHIIQMLPAACQEICSHGNVQCNSYLKADYSIKCNTAKHGIYGKFSSASLIYCIGFPLSMFALLKYARHNTGKYREKRGVILAGTRFLYENYSQDCWYWEVVELVRKIVVTSMLILMNAESRTSLGLTAIFSGLFSVGFAYSKPVNEAFEHWLQLISLMASSVNFTTGMLMKIPEEESSSGITNQTDRFIVTFFLVGANVLVIAVVAVKYLSNVVTTVLAFRENPKCDASCCLEILQLVNDAPGEINNMSAPSTESQDLFQNVAEAQNEEHLDEEKKLTIKDGSKKI